eukprot:535750_1
MTAPAMSVNIKWVEDWNKADMLCWIKTLQGRYKFEGKKSYQATIMMQIVKQKKLTGGNLAKCDTVYSLITLFQNKIKHRTAKVLQENLRLERAMYQQRKLSQTIIKKGQWAPKVGEKIRCVEIR